MVQKTYGESPRFPHACLISAGDMSLAMTEARRMAAAAICEGKGEKPCGLCRHCRKAAGDIHPDISIIGRPLDDKGKKKKEIVVAQVRALSADACLLPNEAKRKVYIIEEAESMNPAAQNAALKLFEEPPLGAMFILCASNPLQLLPTVRSRCAQFKLGGEIEAEAKKSGPAASYVKVLACGDEAELLRWCSQNEGMDNQSALEFLGSTKLLLADMLCGRENPRGLEASRLMELCALMDKCIDYLHVNVGVKHIFGLLAVSSIAGSGNRG